jgi:hypothetical protein
MAQIPRFVETHRTTTNVPIHEDEYIHAAVERANRIWAETGIEFWVRSIERYVERQDQRS